MFLKFVVVFYTMFSVVFAAARLTDNQVNFKIETEKITVTTRPGFHLNEKAPASVIYDGKKNKLSPSVKTQKEFVFTQETKAKNAELEFYVCDDKNTVCEKHLQILNLKSGAATSIKKETVGYNNIQDFNLQSKDGRPTLLVFSAPWCPACVRMATETFPKLNVAKQLSKLNFIKLNSDLPENNELSEKFGIKAIPTMILLDKSGVETFRWLDFQPANGFAKNMEQELKKVNLLNETVLSAQLGDPKAASVLAFKAYAALNYEEAYRWFSLTTSEKDQKFKLSAEVNLAQEKSDEDKKFDAEYLAALEKAIVLTTSKIDQLRWTLDYLTKKDAMGSSTPQIKVRAAALLQEIDLFLKKPNTAAAAFKASTYGDYSGFEISELLWMKSKTYSILNQKEMIEGNNKKSIQSILKKKLDVSRPGEMLTAIYYLREAGEVKKVEDLYSKLIKAYPSTYVYAEKFARFAQKNKDYEKALLLVDDAIKYPQGNLPQLSLLKSTLLFEVKKNKEALELIDRTLKLDYITHPRYSRTLKKLEELKNKLE
jgi:thiol-disulfide isomerase/thioredoxin